MDSFDYIPNDDGLHHAKCPSVEILPSENSAFSKESIPPKLHMPHVKSEPLLSLHHMMQNRRRDSGGLSARTVQVSLVAF